MAESNLTEASNKKLAAGLLAIFLGSFGVHKFVLGYWVSGLVMFLVAAFASRTGFAGLFVGVVGLIEGVIYLTKTPEEFDAIYLQQSRRWF